MKAVRIFYDKARLPDGTVVEMTIWQLPRATVERPHGLKYSLFYGYDGQRVVGYDNERGKGDHKHLGALGACRTWGVESENRPQRGQFLPALQAHSPAMGQKDGEKWTAAVDLQPTIPKSDRLLQTRYKFESVDKMIADFLHDVERMKNEHHP